MGSRPELDFRDELSLTSDQSACRLVGVSELISRISPGNLCQCRHPGSVSSACLVRTLATGSEKNTHTLGHNDDQYDVGTVNHVQFCS